ncbi:MAG TPA: hypothetical protein EYG76_02620 [Methanothermococcus okinawensis]|uniref:carbonic anhydrase n=1 Tax=Methanothermococcus okinawensis TaxID=155863 RepID=A0A833DRH7_9EURY|nr:hypothetical protein [Methanothermococcus okinawensis]
MSKLLEERPSITASAIEYAVSVLGVEHIIVFSHSQCGACAALYRIFQILQNKWCKRG